MSTIKSKINSLFRFRATSFSKDSASCLWLGLGVLTSVSIFTVDQHVLAQASFPDDFPNGAATTTPSGTFNTPTQYLVYVPSDITSLEQVKVAVPDAFRGKLDSGQPVYQIGRFNNLNLAQRRVDELKQAGLPASVTTVNSKFPAVITSVGRPISTPVSAAPISGPSPLATIPQANAPNIVTAPPVPNLPGVPTPTAQYPAQAPIAGNPYGQFPEEQTIEINRSPSSVAPMQMNPEVAPTPLPQSVFVPPTTPPQTVVMENRFVVMVPTGSQEVLEKAKTIVPTARFSVSRLGTFIEVQRYPDRFSADTLSRTMRSRGIDARVSYF